MAWNDYNYTVIFILDYFEMIRNDEIRRNDSILGKDKNQIFYDSLIQCSFNNLNKQVFRKSPK